MSKPGYDDIKSAWEDEVQNQSLQSLSDLRLSRMTSHLMKKRLELAGIEAENRLQADLRTQEILNMEFMLRDLLEIRREKILEVILRGGTISANVMTVSEGEFYSRLERAFGGHKEFIEGSITGDSSRIESEESSSNEQDDQEDYIIAIFERAIEEPIVGLDELVHGPFEKDCVATIPRANAMRWLQDGTISRVIID